MPVPTTNIPIEALRRAFGSALQEHVSMASYTTAHVGGPVDALVVAHSAGDLEEAALRLWELDVPFLVLGSGSNVLVSDQGLRGVVVLNRARAIKVDATGTPPSVWAESGANFGTIARQVALRGLSGLEWAATIPGTLGGAVYGNAGAYGSDMADNLMLAEILHPTGNNRGEIQNWTADQMEYSYRSSVFKRAGTRGVILAAQLKLEASTPEAVQARMEANAYHRRRTQPPGASLGSMFKNPPGDYAGRLIEAAGMKGKRIGGAEISQVHANFFINHGDATASEVGQLISQARQAVTEQFGVELELEVQLLGEWPTL